MKPCKERAKLDQLVRALEAEYSRLNNENIRLQDATRDTLSQLNPTPEFVDIHVPNATENAEQALRRARQTK